jgi:cysteine synthase B
MGFGSNGLLTQIGNTPLLKIVKLEGVEIYAKAEWFNPGGSVKDRPALWMIEDGERSGRLTRGKVILDATSGNMGIALAMIGAVKGYRVELVMPGSASEERKKILRAYGAEIRFSDPLEGSDGAILEARRLRAENPERYFYADQYNNPSNPRAHYETTGPEIIRQTKGRVTHFVAGIGTGGTIMGTGRRLKEYNKEIRVIAVEPDSGLHGLEGLKHMETSIVPGVYDEGFQDGKIRVSTEEAYEMVWRLAREEGLLAGLSSGAALKGALEVASEIGEGVIVTIFPDGGDRYLSTPLWQANSSFG